MKKIYELPELNVSMFEESNILTTGSGTGQGDTPAEENFEYSGKKTTVKISWEEMEAVF